MRDARLLRGRRDTEVVIDDEQALCIAMRVAAIKVRLMQLYTNEEADSWIQQPQRVLDEQRPIDMVGDILGYLEVDNVVDQMLDCTYL